MLTMLTSSLILWEAMGVEAQGTKLRFYFCHLLFCDLGLWED